MIRRLARGVLSGEWLILLAMVAIFWVSDLNRIGGLVLWLPLLAARWVVERRLWRHTPLDWWFGLWFALGLIDLGAAPYQYAPFRLGGTLYSLPVAYSLIALSRPVLGMVLVTSFASMADRVRRMSGLLLVSAGLALLVGVLGLFAGQYTVKSAIMQPILDLLPNLRGFPGAEGGFNVNEIAGAMAWLAPLMAGLAIYYWRERRAETGRAARTLRIVAPIAFVLLWTALFFGQSRSAILGVIPAVAALVLFLLRGRWRWIGMALVLVFVVLQVVVYTTPVPGNNETNRLERVNEISGSSRQEMWSSALSIIRDYPLTGVGINMYRAQPVRDKYPVPSYANGILPHAHNEWLQATTDLGIPGLIVFVGFQLSAAWMLWRAWRAGSRRDKAIALAIGAGLFAHAVFGLADAITLWDRFAFLYWWMMGLAAAQYAIVVPARAPSEADSMVVGEVAPG